MNFLVKRSLNRAYWDEEDDWGQGDEIGDWVLDTGTLDIIKASMEKSKSDYVNFVGVVGSRNAFSNCYRVATEGIVLRSLPGPVTHEVSYELEVNAPHLSTSADSYAILMEFVLLVCSHVVYVQHEVEEITPVWPRCVTAIVSEDGSEPGVKKHVHMVVKPKQTVHYDRQTLTCEVGLGSVESLAALKALLSYWPRTKLHASNSHTKRLSSVYTNMFRNPGHIALNPALKKDTFVETLLKYVDRCNNPVALPSTSMRLASRGPEPTNMDKLVAASVKTKCLKDFNEFISGLKNILFLEETVLNLEFRAFIREAARKGFQSFVYNVPLATREDMITKAFQTEFDNFKREYLAKEARFLEFQVKIDNQLRKIEEAMIESWKSDTLTQFLDHLSEKYKNDLSTFDYSCKDYNLTSQYQLRLSKCNQYHEKCVLSAGQALLKKEKQLNESFANHIENPGNVRLPAKPTILESDGEFTQAKSLSKFVKEALEEKYKFMLQLCEGQKKSIEKSIAATAIAIREEAKKRFQEQARVSITSAMNGITLAK